MGNRDQAVKFMEDPISSFSSFFDYFPATTPLDCTTTEAEKGSLGFMELLGIQDFGSSSLFNASSLLQEPVGVFRDQTESSLTQVKAETPTVPESPEVLNAPATPNSSSISSESSGAPNNDHTKLLDEGQEHHKTNKHLKAKKTSQKRQREPRFAFMTKSDVDQLEDGFRWRKYGQKAVKNSPFPRSYYRCTSASCNVKKRVERSFNDPAVVVTTYEGQHTHPSPMMHRLGPVGVSRAQDDSAFLTANNIGAIPLGPMWMTLSQQPRFSNLTPMNCGFTVNRNGTLESSICAPPSTLLRDNGLLQDIVPSVTRNQE